jgi:hypothetical protein
MEPWVNFDRYGGAFASQAPLSLANTQRYLASVNRALGAYSYRLGAKLLGSTVAFLSLVL